MNALTKAKNIVNKLKTAEQRKRVKHALTFGARIVGAVALESLGKDPRVIKCQMAFMSLNFGLTTRLYDVQYLQELANRTASVKASMDCIVTTGALSDELKAKAYKSELVDAADLSYPIIVDSNTRLILDGRHRYEKARRLGHKTISVVFLDAETLPYFERSTLTNEVSMRNI